VPIDPNPMDFAAWMEVWLGDRWWTFDPRNNIRRKGRILIGRGVMRTATTRACRAPCVCNAGDGMPELPPGFKVTVDAKQGRRH